MAMFLKCFDNIANRKRNLEDWILVRIQSPRPLGTKPKPLDSQGFRLSCFVSCPAAKESTISRICMPSWLPSSPRSRVDNVPSWATKLTRFSRIGSLYSAKLKRQDSDGFMHERLLRSHNISNLHSIKVLRLHIGKACLRIQWE